MTAWEELVGIPVYVDPGMGPGMFTILPEALTISEFQRAVQELRALMLGSVLPCRRCNGRRRVVCFAGSMACPECCR